MVKGVINGVVQPGYDHLGNYYGGRETHFYIHTDGGVVKSRARVRDQLTIPERVPAETFAATSRQRAEPGRRAQDFGTSAAPRQTKPSSGGVAGDDCEETDDQGAPPDIVRKAGDPRPEVRAAAMRDFKAMLDRHYRRRVSDQEMEQVLSEFLDWVRSHGDGVIASKFEGSEDPRMIRAGAGSYTMPPRQIPGMERESLVGRTSSGTNASERMTSSTQDRAPRNPLVTMQARNKQFWAGRVF